MYEQALKDAGKGDDDINTYIKSIGKPFEDVYEIALRHVFGGSDHTDSTIDRSRVCMVGDALETDVAGGCKYGLSTVWVLKDGVYQNEFEAAATTASTTDQVFGETATAILNSFNEMDGTYAKGMKLSPSYILPHFRW